MERTAPAPGAGGARVVPLDVLRVLVVAMVIVHHAAQAYGPTGGAWPVHDQAQSDWFQPFYTVNAAVGLGLLFLIAGYFVPGSYDRKGPRRFLRQRWARLGVPLVVFTAAVNLPIVYMAASRPPLREFVAALYDSGWQGLYLHLWFLVDLLVFSAVYVAWRSTSAHRVPRHRSWPPPGHAAIAGFVLLLTLVTWIVRWWYPVDEWVPLLFVIPVEPAHLPQYASLFALGTVAYREDWLRRMPAARGLTWLALGLIASAGVFTVEALGRWDDVIAAGGPTWPSLVRSAWESVICVGLAVGLVTLFRQVLHGSHRFLSGAATASFAAYIVHVYLVVLVQGALYDVPATAFVKFAAAAVLGLLLSFGAGYASGFVPGVRTLLGNPRAAPPRQASG